MNILKRWWFAIQRRDPFGVHQPVTLTLDDRLQEIIGWIEDHPEFKHIVAVRTGTARVMIERRFADRGNVRVFSIGQLLSGRFFREDDLVLSCTCSLSDEMQYRQLTARLRGARPIYNVALAPGVVLREPTIRRGSDTGPGPENGANLR
jgi:hypothetical protein